MKTGVVCVLAVVLVGAVVVTAPVQAVERERAQALMEKARAIGGNTGGTEAAAKAIKTVVVRCDKGESVQAALDKNPGPVVIEIQGICAENVRIERRSDVTLLGRDPNTDGLRGVDESSLMVFTLEAWYSKGMVLRDLSFNNAMSGAALHFSDAEVSGCRFNDNRGVGLRLDRMSFVNNAYGIEASRNGARGVDLLYGSYLQCQSCVLKDNGGANWSHYAASVWFGSWATFWNSEVSGRLGLLAWGDDSYVDVDCMNGSEPEHPCYLSATQRAVQAVNGGDVAALGATVTGAVTAQNDNASASLRGSQLTGRLSIHNASLWLIGSHQSTGTVALTGNSAFIVGGLLDGDGNVTETASFGPTTLQDWTHATFGYGTVIDNLVTCTGAADAILTGATFGGDGAITGCEHASGP